MQLQNVGVFRLRGTCITVYIVTILEGAEVRIGFYGRGGRILRGDTSEGAEGPEGWPLG